jgi:hypothetical protein
MLRCKADAVKQTGREWLRFLFRNLSFYHLDSISFTGICFACYIQRPKSVQQNERQTRAVAGHSDRAVTGKGSGRIVIGIVGSNPA